MLVLAIDTALDSCAAAVLDTRTRQFLALEALPMKRGHAEALMPLIARVMAQFGAGFEALDRIAVTTGPGSFTGLRVGISAARGLALAAGKEVVGLTTLTAYAAPQVSEQHDTAILAAIDARHDHVYYQVVTGNGSTLVNPAVAPIDETFDAARFGPLRIVGNAAQIIAARWPAQAEKPVLVDPQPAPDIAWVAWGGALADPASALPKPFYLRAPDAKPKSEWATEPRS
jgi:tRNA threonylcarbamoyl adenosine modification protein YeaZ